MKDLVTKYIDTALMINDTPSSVRTWRLMTTAICLTFVFHISWACNWIPGMPGFASSAEVMSQGKAIQKIQLSLLESNILDVKQQQCLAVNKDFFTRRLQELLREYQTVTKQQYQIPTCRDFGLQE